MVISGGMYDLATLLEAGAQFLNPKSPRRVADLTRSVERVPRHTIVVRGEHDLLVVERDSPTLAAAIHAFGGSVEEFTVPDADHYAVVEGFANPNSAVFRAAGGADGNAEARG